MASANKIMGYILGMVVGVYAFVYVGIPAITELFTADTSSWDSGAASLLTVIPIMIMLALFVYFAEPAMDSLS